MRTKYGYDIAPGDFVLDFPGGIVEKTIERGDLTKIIFTDERSMLIYSDYLIRVATESD